MRQAAGTAAPLRPPCLHMRPGLPPVDLAPSVAPPAPLPPLLGRPPYLSNLCLELWRQPSGEQYVKVSSAAAGAGFGALHPSNPPQTRRCSCFRRVAPAAVMLRTGPVPSPPLRRCCTIRKNCRSRSCAAPPPASSNCSSRPCGVAQGHPQGCSRVPARESGGCRVLARMQPRRRCAPHVCCWCPLPLQGEGAGGLPAHPRPAPEGGCKTQEEGGQPALGCAASMAQRRCFGVLSGRAPLHSPSCSLVCMRRSACCTFCTTSPRASTRRQRRWRWAAPSRMRQRAQRAQQGQQARRPAAAAATVRLEGWLGLLDCLLVQQAGA